MTFTLSSEQHAEALAAIEPIEAALARYDAPKNTLHRDRLAAAELMPLIAEHGRLFHTLLRGELSAIEEAGDAALASFVSDATARARMVASFDFVHRNQALRDSLSAGMHNADALLRRAAALFRDFTNPS